MRRLALAATLALAFASSSRALLVQGYDAAVNERFVSGFSSAPVANTSAGFTLSGYDLSGVGWRDNASQIAVTLVSPEHFLTAAHVAPAVGTTVSFLGSDGVKRTYTVDSVTTLTYGDKNTDLSLGRLTEVVDTSHIASYFGFYLGNLSETYAGLPVTLYGANGRVGTNTLSDAGNFDLLPFGGGDGDIDSVVTLTDFDSVTGEAQGQGGDSGSPTFVRIVGNQLALLGVHSAIATASGVDYTLDTFAVATAYHQINLALQNAGYEGWLVYNNALDIASPIPEPASAAALLGAAALVFAAPRRRRA